MLYSKNLLYFGCCLKLMKSTFDFRRKKESRAAHELSKKAKKLRGIKWVIDVKFVFMVSLHYPFPKYQYVFTILLVLFFSELSCSTRNVTLRRYRCGRRKLLLFIIENNIVFFSLDCCYRIIKNWVHQNCYYCLDC